MAQVTLSLAGIEIIAKWFSRCFKNTSYLFIFSWKIPSISLSCSGINTAFLLLFVILVSDKSNEHIEDHKEIIGCFCNLTGCHNLYWIKHKHLPYFFLISTSVKGFWCCILVRGHSESLWLLHLSLYYLACNFEFLFPEGHTQGITFFQFNEHFYSLCTLWICSV